MLTQVPRGSNQAGSQNAKDNEQFEAALRRDLKSTPSFVAYDNILGGAWKRAFDVVLTLLTAPLWAPLTLAVAAYSKLRYGGRVVETREFIGYGGRFFNRFTLRLKPAEVDVEPVRAGAESPANDWTVIAAKAEGRPAKWRHALRSLPQLLNVLRGEMSLVGPKPLTHDEVELLKSGKRYYLSQRPGIVGLNALIDDEKDRPNLYKIYALSWTVGTDALILWEAVRSLWNRGELWKPGRALKVAAHGAAAKTAAIRRRTPS